MKKLILLLGMLLVLSGVVSAIDCSVWSCDVSDYNWADFSNPAWNGTASDGQNIKELGWETYEGEAYYDASVYNTAPVSIKVVDWDVYHGRPAHTVALDSSFNALCLDAYFDELAVVGENKGNTINLASDANAGTNQGITNNGIDCQNDVSGILCYYTGTVYIDIPIKVSADTWITLCAYWNGSQTLLTIYNGSDTVNVAPIDNTGKTWSVDFSQPGKKIYVSGHGNDIHIDNYREFNGTLGDLGVPLPPDSDGDGVLDEDDLCPNTTDEEPNEPNIYGCSCRQILEIMPGNHRGELKHGCSKGTINVFTKLIGWARHLFE